MRRTLIALAAWLFASGALASNLTQTICLVGNSTWTVPTDWNDANNTIELVAGGGAAGTAINGFAYGGGGGGYSEKINLALTPGASITYQTHNVDACFQSCATVKAVHGANFVFNPGGGGAGGAASGGVGDVKHSGGAGDLGPYGGGAGGPHGDGVNGFNGSGGGAGDAGFGGAGNAGTGSGGAGAEWTCTSSNVASTVGSGGGSGTAGVGGLYGAGSSSDGLLVITYTPRQRTAAGVF